MSMSVASMSRRKSGQYDYYECGQYEYYEGGQYDYEHEYECGNWSFLVCAVSPPD